MLFPLLVTPPAIWGGFAIWYRAPGGRAARTLCAAVWWVFCGIALVAMGTGHRALGTALLAVGLSVLLAWWLRLRPTHDRIWADDVAKMTFGTIEPGQVTLHNVRNFDWRSTADYTPQWETRTYEPERLRSVDMTMSYWSSAAIAHMLISFGFEDANYVAFSVEIRRQKYQRYSEIGGFFKEFELSIIAADERDVLRLRTNVRGEDAYMYRLRLPASARRQLFLSYVAEANTLAKQPRFYNTIMVNCTTLVYQMMKRIVGHLPLDFRLLFSGYLPEYVHRVGGFDRRFSLQELRSGGRLTERARTSDRKPTFSTDIRRGLPGSD